MLLFFLCVGDHDIEYYHCEQFNTCEYSSTICTWNDICVNRQTYSRINREITGEWCGDPITTNETYPSWWTLIASTETTYFYCYTYVHVAQRTFIQTRTLARTPQLTSTPLPAIPTCPKVIECTKTKNKLRVQVVYALLN